MKHPGIMVEQGVYGEENLRSSIKMITVAPELVGSKGLIKSLSEDYNIVVSLGHSAADIDTGLKALSTGAKALTHVFNAMIPLNHRAPGLVGLIASPQAPYFSIIPDGIHLHPTTVSMAYRANPEKCILITDSLEMAGMPDGLYPGHAQVPHKQRKVGNKVTIDGTDTLIGSCISMDECVRNLREYSGCTLASAVRCVTENIANLMGLQDRGILSSGRRADLVALDSRGYVQKVWIKGQEVFRKKIEQTCPRDE
jgi:N-acetylglucosamine-6-phosphate deacetylase